jgi:hypothetical protein
MTGDTSALPGHVRVGHGPLISALDDACAETGLKSAERYLTRIEVERARLRQAIRRRLA